MGSDTGVRSQSVIRHRSEPKKRGILDVEGTSDDGSHKRVKIRDLQSVFRSEERGGNTTHPDVHSDSRTLDLNIGICPVDTLFSDGAQTIIDESSNCPAMEKDNVQCNGDGKKAKGLDLDLNVEDNSSSINDAFYPCKNNENLKPRDELDCESSVGVLGAKDSMRVWKGLKQNNYMSVLYGSTPVHVPVRPAPLPKPRGRKKSNNDVMKRKIELAKKEQVDRFARVAAPSGLLNGLNPGIINHVRNSKQVHSIIEALVRSERRENQLSENKEGNQTKNGIQEPTERKEQGNVQGSGASSSGIIHGDITLGRQQMSDYTILSKSIHSNEGLRRDNDLQHKGQMRTLSRMPLQCNIEHGDDELALKLSSSVMDASGISGCLSNDESANTSSVTSLSFKAANIASQWLVLLSQDIRGRLAALRRSKKRVRDVITTELPLLISREFSPYSEKDSCMPKDSKICHRDQAVAHAHSVRWSALFAQMDKTLSKEESHLESWLNQVKEMQLHCEKGLYINSSSSCHSQQQAAPNQTDSKYNALDESANDLAVRAAAASIYSTCNFLLSTENLPCY